jgi:hypothetical protein
MKHYHSQEAQPKASQAVPFNEAPMYNPVALKLLGSRAFLQPFASPKSRVLLARDRN